MLYDAQRRHALATSGIYSYVRHPQYVGFVLVMFGFLLQWPTLLTLAMFPVSVYMYVRLSRVEEREAIAEFGAEYERYMRSKLGGCGDEVQKIGAQVNPAFDIRSIAVCYTSARAKIPW